MRRCRVSRRAGTRTRASRRAAPPARPRRTPGRRRRRRRRCPGPVRAGRGGRDASSGASSRPPSYSPYSRSVAVRLWPESRTTPSGARSAQSLCDGVQQRGPSGSGRTGEPHRAAARQQTHQPLTLLRALQERQLGRRGSRRYGGRGRALAVGALGGSAADRSGGLLPGRAQFDLAAVDRVDREQEVAGEELYDASLLRAAAGRIRCSTGRGTVVGRCPRRSRRCHGRKLPAPGVSGPSPNPPDASRTVAPPGLARPAVASGPVSATWDPSIGGRPNPKPSHSIYEPSGCRAVQDITVR